ncbi:MAG: hypothetical protein US51_C0046G0007 [Microgenomates group bacterium GW2011_GWA2_37_6]|nr:MAG: hypothetical protein US51_C0046G0007 [Microgenomates group bacterium GW2011_GWA2_37_6]
MLKKSLLLFFSWKALVLFFAYLATLLLPFKEFPNSFIADPVFGRSLPYFVLIRSLNIFGVHPVIAGQIISNIFFLGALFVSLKLLSIDKKRSSFLLFGAVLILFPTSFFYGAVYNDSLFFFLATTSLYFARKRSFLLASVAGALATLSRLNGLVLVFPILFEFLSAKDKNPLDTWNLTKLKEEIGREIRKLIPGEKVYFVILIPLAFLGYLLFTQINYESWTKVFSAMSVWNQDKVIFPLQVFWRYIKIIGSFEFSNYVYQVALIELLFVVLYIGVLIYSYKKIRFSYWLFFAVSILIPSLTGTFQGMPRYGLHLYPFFLSLVLFLEQRSIPSKLIYFAISVFLLYYCLSLFTRGYFIA